MATARIVINLKKLDALIKQGIKDGSIVIEKTTLNIDADKTFDV